MSFVSIRRLGLLMASVSVLHAGASYAQTAPSKAATDVEHAAAPAWLDQIDGAQAMDWVRAQNQKTLNTLGQKPLFKSFYDASLKLLQTHDRLAMPEQIDGMIYNFWRDASHQRGILRRTTQADYASEAPNWTTVLDLDALAASEQKNWVYHGLSCLDLQQSRCLLALSDGGEDAVTQREFDLSTGKFVPNGFTLPHAKMAADWLDRDTLLVSYPWTEKDVTKSSYPYIVKILKRGKKLSSATTVFTGKQTDVSVDPFVLHDGKGNQVALIREGIDAFSSRFYQYEKGRIIPLDLPERADVTGLLGHKLVVRLDQDWDTHGPNFQAGSVVLVDLDRRRMPQMLVQPQSKQVIEAAVVSHGHILVSLYDNVRGELHVFTPSGDTFNRSQLPLPKNLSVNLISADHASPLAYAESEGFLTPPTVWSIDTDAATVREVHTLPAQFDASAMTVDQFQARSTDGTDIPYFVVHAKDMPHNDANPTLLYAYGGFEVPLFPSYSAGIGVNWLSHGGVYVLANIRGGGEFGPAWHEAGLKTRRQHIYDDFAAVAHDLAARHITSSQHLAIRGGSNGGLLMGVEFTQHPDFWKAVDIEVPLLDMMNYEHMSAGASWVGEYGTVSIPEQRDFLRKISPLQNLKAGTQYPVPFIETTTKDDRVGPVHARRFAWRMSELNLPYYYWEQVAGGHGFGASQTEIAQTQALSWTYAWSALGGVAH
ncbi:prolyl oligopeptidase [Neokomagataea thailandica NBRC 106555]|nr:MULTISPECIES: prolyl oligopeptidase family serine peptidase [Neokomagataea]GBR53463.1 prolyl oligopeptidase [Neokomagataea thailandica NBRC 106555]